MKVKIEGMIGKPDEKLKKQLEGLGVGAWTTYEDVKSQWPATDEVEVEVNSIGGDVVEGLSIYDFIRAQAQFQKVTTVGIRIDSIASVVFLAGDTRKVSPKVQGLIHQAWMSPNDMNPDWEINQQAAKALAEHLNEADTQIKGVYAERCGRANLKAITEAMAASTTLNAEQLIALGFASEIIEAGTAIEGRAMAFNLDFYNQLNSDLKMNEELLKMMKAIKAMLRGSTKAMSVTLADGQNLYIFSEDGEFVGKKAVLADAEGQPTEQVAPAGEHGLQDGRTIVVGDGGMISEVREAASAATPPAGEQPNPEVEALKAQLMEKEKEIEAMKAAVTSSDDQMKALAAKFTEMEAAMKNFALGGEDKKSAEATQDFSKMTPSQRAYHVAIKNLNQN